jgi:hypothetical protein
MSPQALAPLELRQVAAYVMPTARFPALSTKARTIKIFLRIPISFIAIQYSISTAWPPPPPTQSLSSFVHCPVHSQAPAAVATQVVPQALAPLELWHVAA